MRDIKGIKTNKSYLKKKVYHINIRSNFLKEDEMIIIFFNFCVKNLNVKQRQLKIETCCIMQLYIFFLKLKF